MSTFRKTILSLLLLSILGVGLCWLYADRILDDLLRPRLVQIAVETLDAKVTLQSLRWSDKGMTLEGLTLQLPATGTLSVARIEAEFSFATLWRRRLTALHIFAPQLELIPSGDRPESTAPPAELPDKLPVTIDRLTVVNGGLQLTLDEQQLRLREITLEGQVAEESPFRIEALLGAGSDHPLSLVGSFRLAAGAALTLDRFDYQQRPFLDRPLTLRLSGSGLEQGGGALTIADFDQQQLSDILGALDITNPVPEGVGFSVTDLRVSFSRTETGNRIGLKVAAGEVSQGAYRIPFAVNDLQLSDRDGAWLAQGKLASAAGTTIELTARYTEEELNGRAQLLIPSPDQLKSDLLGGAPPGIGGALKLDARFAVAPDRLDLALDFRGEARPPSDDDLVDLAPLSGQANLHRSQNKERLSLDLRESGRPLFQATGDLSAIDFKLIASDLNRLQRLASPRLLPPELTGLEGLSASGKLSRGDDQRWSSRLDLDLQGARFADLEVGEVALQLHVAGGSARITARDLALSAELTLGEELSARVDAELAANWSATGASIQLNRLLLDDLNYLSEDGLTGLAGGRINIAGEIQKKPADDLLRLELTGDTAIAEVLAGDFYADLANLGSSFSLSGLVSPATRTLDIDRLQLQSPAVGSLTASGKLGTEEVLFDTRLTIPDLARTYGNNIGPMLAEIWPDNEGLTIEGGLSATANLHWTPAGWRAIGEVQPQRLDAFWERHELEMSDASGQLPFHLAQGQPPPQDAAGERRGEISFHTLAAGVAVLKQSSLSLAAQPNLLILSSPLRLQLAGGEVAIDALELGRDEQGPKGSIQLNISAVDLQLLTEELGLPVMQGALTGDLGTISYGNHQLQTDGTISLNVFGGQLLLHDMSYRNPFSRYPIFHGDIDFSGIDLLQATKTFEFGEMNGIIDGKIHGLRLFGTTPSAFEATIATRSEGKRNISVKALNNLSIISQGGISAALSRGIYRFIDFYRYNKIGFECALENDTFTLEGTALGGSTRYLVAGGLLPPRIDITTTTPTISFKEMVKRLGRIDRTGN